MQPAGRWLIAVTLLVAAAGAGGCLVGDGEGWFEGDLWVGNCKDGDPLGESANKRGFYDLDADFFAGEPKEDTNQSPTQRRNSLLVRVQPTSNNMEVSDGLMLQFMDPDQAARAFASGEPIGITNRSLCNGTYCAPTQDEVLRAHLYLYTTCPDLQSPLIGSTYVLSATSDGDCLKHLDASGTPPSPPWTPPCPQLTATTRATLDGICAGDFTNRDNKALIQQHLGGASQGACVYLCAFGQARRGQNSKELEGFLVDYGDPVAGLVHMNLVDGRAVNLDTCAEVAGQITGMFTFEVVRGRAAQSFP